MGLKDLVLLDQSQDKDQGPEGEDHPQGWVLRRITAKHKNIAALLAQGCGRTEIASVCGCTPEYVTMLSKQALFLAYLKDMSGVVSVRLEALFDKTADVIAETMESGTEDGRLKAARLQLEVTGRVGKNRPSTGEDEGDSLDQLAERLVALKRKVHNRTIDGEVTDVTFVEVGPGEKQGSGAQGS